MQLVLDANILIRAVLGSRVLLLLQKYLEQTEFVAPESEAREHLPAFCNAAKVPVAPAMAILDFLPKLVTVVELRTYEPCSESKIAT